VLLRQHAYQTNISKSPARNTAQTASYQTSFYEPLKFSASTSAYLNITLCAHVCMHTSINSKSSFSTPLIIQISCYYCSYGVNLGFNWQYSAEGSLLLANSCYINECTFGKMHCIKIYCNTVLNTFNWKPVSVMMLHACIVTVTC